MILSYFQNVVHILSQLTDNEMLQVAVTESAKIIPYIVSSRKVVKVYLKVGCSVQKAVCIFLTRPRNAWSSGRPLRIAFGLLRSLRSGSSLLRLMSPSWTAFSRYVVWNSHGVFR